MKKNKNGNAPKSLLEIYSEKRLAEFRRNNEKTLAGWRFKMRKPLVG